MTTPLMRALCAHIDSVFKGPNGDYPAILESLIGLSAEQARWKTAPGRNSIWMLVEHLIDSKKWLIDTLERIPTNSPVWVEPTGGETEWQDSLTRLKDAHQRLKKTIEKFSDAELFRVPNPKDGLTLLELILSGGPAHDAHHGGQIDYLKGMQAR